MEILDSDKKLELVDELDRRGVPFRAFWNLSDIFFTEEIPTACVTFSETRIKMLFNPEFWKELSETGQLFVICHEQFHIISDHFRRMCFHDGDAQLKNKAADVAVNHALIRNYDFEKTDLPDWEKYCWVETLFPDQDIPDNETAQFYYALLQSQHEKGNMCCEGGECVDDHLGAGEIPKQLQDMISKVISDHIKEQTEGMSDDEIEDFMEDFREELGVSYDTEGFGHHQQTHHIKPKEDLQWKQVYKNIPKKLYSIRQKSHWINRQRNHMLLPDELMLPCELEEQKEDIVRVLVYLDSSGSCISHAKFFLEHALTLPRKMFDVHLFGFGTVVYPLTKTPPYNLKGFGNESYAAVSEHVNSFGKKVDAVFVFTDGYSRSMVPHEPRKWHWFITPSGTKTQIDKNCNIYELEKLGWKGKGR